MKNKKIYLSASLALLAFASCTNDMQELETNQPQLLKQIVMTTEDFLSETGSRTLYDIADGAVTCTWAENDTVGVFPNEGIQTAFPMASGAGTKNATFDGGGWALKDGSTYGAYYPCIGKFYLDKHAVPVSYEGQTQVGNASMAHLGAYDYMVATPVAPEFGSANFMFKHMSALVQLKLTIPEPATLTSVKLVADTESFAVMGKVDIMADAPSITAVTSASEVEQTLQEVSTTEENQVVTLYLMLPPADLSAQTLKAVVTTDKGTLEMTLENKNFQAGKVYALSGEMKGDYKSGVATLIEAGTLQQLLGDDWLDITSLKVVGPINGDDVRCLRQMLGGKIKHSVNIEKGKLAMLDLSEATIVEGGEWYYEDSYEKFYTANDAIGDYMFYQCVNLEQIDIPDAVNTIGDNAFRNCSALTSFEIPDGVTSIGYNAFCNCIALASIYISDGVVSIGNGAFDGCYSLKSDFDIPDSVSWIGNYAFRGCSSLTSIEIPDGVTEIAEGVFQNCSSLTTVTIGDGVSLIGDFAFSSCSSLTSIDIPDNVTSIGEYAFMFCTEMVTVTIGDGVSLIGESAFSNCTALASIDIPDNVSSIGIGAFEFCVSLNSLTIGDGITSIDDSAFMYCSSLTSVYIKDLSAWCRITFSNISSNPLCYGANLYLDNIEMTELVIPEDITKIKDYAFSRCKSLVKVVIPDVVYSIGNTAFGACDALTTVTIGDSVSSIDYGAFQNCDALTTVTIGAGVSSIGDTAFDDCDALTSINIPDNVTSIGNTAFYSCDALTTVTIGSGVTSIGSSAFEYCDALTDFYCHATTPPSIDSSVFNYYGDETTLHVPSGCVADYQSSDWGEFFPNIKEMGSGQ